MKAGWTVKPLAEICQFQRGLTYAKSDEVPESSSVVLRANNVDLESHALDLSDLKYISDDVQVPANKKICKGSLLICTASGSKSHLGKVAYIDQSNGYAFGGFMGQITPNETVDGRYLFYVLISPAYKEFIAALSDGANINNLKYSDLGSFRVAMPCLDEQQRIVNILDAAFADIATAKANAEKNLQNARALFDSYLSQVFTECGQDWQVKTVSEIAKHSLGKMLDKAKNKGQLQPYLRNLNVRWFEFDLAELQEMLFQPEEEAKYTAIKGDVLICEGGYPGRAAIWPEDYPIHFQKALHRVRFHEPAHNEWFLYYLYSQDKSGALKQHFTGTGIQHFTGEALARFQIPLPSSLRIESALVNLRELHQETQHLESIGQQKLTALDKLKKSLLHQAFSGAL